MNSSSPRLKNMPLDVRMSDVKDFPVSVSCAPSHSTSKGETCQSIRKSRALVEVWDALSAVFVVCFAAVMIAVSGDHAVE